MIIDNPFMCILFDNILSSDAFYRMSLTPLFALSDKEFNANDLKE